MENQSPKDTFIAATKVIIRKDLSSEFKQAEKYLLGFEKSEESWGILFDTLQSENLDLNVYVYAANILKKKLQYDFYQLPSDHFSSLGNLIIGIFSIIIWLIAELLQKFDYHPITSQLAIALCLLYLRGYEKMGDILKILEDSLFKTEKREIQILQLLEVNRIDLL
jgi:hypothetical protein